MAEKAKTGAEANTKAVKFQDFLVENNINVFSTESLGDNFNTVVFRSRIETNGQILPMAIFIDTSVFTIIRTQVVAGVNKEKQKKIRKYLNDLNAQYKIFKYYLRDSGEIYLDVCIPYVDETFDCKMIQLMLSVLVQHLDTIYPEFMSMIWVKDEAKKDAHS